MAAKSPVRRGLSATIAVLERHYGSGDPRIAPLRAALATEGLAEHIQQVTENVPLTDDQLSKLVVLLRGGQHG